MSIKSSVVYEIISLLFIFVILTFENIYLALIANIFYMTVKYKISVDIDYLSNLLLFYIFFSSFVRICKSLLLQNDLVNCDFVFTFPN